MERFRLGAKKEKRSKKERKTAWGLCPQTPRIYRLGAKMALKKNRERTDDETGHFTCQEKRTFSFVKNSKIFQIL
jgi:hypothetical protein